MRNNRANKLLIIIILFTTLFLIDSCRFDNRLEEKTNISEVNKKEKKKSHNLAREGNETENNISLEPKFQYGGGVNPFISPVEKGVGVTPTGLPIPSKVSTASPSQVPSLLPKQLPPLPQQKEPEVPITEIPKWPGESPILATGPRQRLDTFLKLKLRGIAYDSLSGRPKYAVIEEKVTDEFGGGTGAILTRSYVVKEGSTFSEYDLKVKAIGKTYVVLTRGNQRIELVLREKEGVSYTPPRYMHIEKPGSEVRGGEVGVGGTQLPPSEK